ncbi:Acetyl-coenzyme A synthetase 2 [Hypsizygus marmoreus]|uniref:Acetyl-coenzyme A synthetase 2 n=1 Tax=Hypsizygus marmoreus TaxID=39966 RepID=A0A369K3J0_HYPMA|nr:Acetyl-coenzyme A synthetase 2 [Hypsizygus marmoreus]
MLKSHLTVLETSASLYSSSPVFKIPRLDALTGQVQEWESITYHKFQSDVVTYARYWARALEGVPQRSVVGLWIGGFTYMDVLHIYGISRAGYIPQLFSVRLPNPAVIYELLHRANAKALIHDSTFASELKDCPLPTFFARSVAKSDAEEPLPVLPDINEEDIAFVFHTSGSTSGSPKLVPCSYRWLNSAVSKSYQASLPQSLERQDVTVWMGSMCHIGQTFMLIGSLQHGSCVIQPTTIAFSSEELIQMVHGCGLNRLNQFAAFLAIHLRRSRNDAKLLSMLASLDEVLYSGLPLPRDEEEWAYTNGIKLRNLFGSTECGAMLLSLGGRDRNAPLLRPLEGVSYEFRPIAPAASESDHQSTARLLELVIRAGSGDCPHTSLRHPDGDFHTGDLFQEPSPGLYVFRGRDDDWIKSENSLRCDTKAIEDNVRAMCGNLIAECVVVGSGRPSPAMFIEPASDMDHNKLKKEIIRKTRQFHSRRYLHERITSANMIVILPPKTLPRTATKGNIRRKAVEETFKAQLDQLYGVSQ